MPTPGAPPQYTYTMEKAWAYVEEVWSREGCEIAGQEGFAAVHALAVKMAHPPLPIFAYLLVICCLLCNGATVPLWGTAAPVVAWLLNINYSQTRKSGLTSLAERAGAKVDEILRKKAAARTSFCDLRLYGY